jgi:hypothetical protein
MAKARARNQFDIVEELQSSIYQLDRDLNSLKQIMLARDARDTNAQQFQQQQVHAGISRSSVDESKSDLAQVLTSPSKYRMNIYMVFIMNI